MSDAGSIQAGQAESGYPAVGELTFNNGYMCTGALITPSVVLTAAHCAGSSMLFKTGTSTSSFVDHRVDQQVKHPSMDLMLVHLAAPISDVTPMTANPGRLPAVGTTCTGIGFGKHYDERTGSTQLQSKRSATERIESASSGTIKVVMVSGVADSGDSGGPLVCDGLIAAVVRSHNDGDWPAHVRESYTTVDAGWIASNLEQLDPGTSFTTAGFDPAFYLDRYADLKAAFGSDRRAALEHWLTYGANEGRRPSRQLDPVFYLNHYGDLQNAFGAGNYLAAYNHWLAYGLSEGRRSSRELEVGYYLASYPDLTAAFGAGNYPAALRHWLTYGLSEGRKTSREFNVGFYLGLYRDLQNAFGAGNYPAAFDHWLNYGLSEGRRTSREFDVGFYLGTYGDLQNAFGARNFPAAFDHWLTYGLSEGRRTSNEFDVGFYLGTYGDLQNAFGARNFPAALDHWLTYGLSEGRRSSQAFDVGYYLGAYPDLQNAFGARNFPAAFDHWLTYGQGEGRRAVP